MIRLIEIDDINLNEVLALRVMECQNGFIEKIADCLHDAKTGAYDISWETKAIVNDNQIIGFTMYGLDKNKCAWLDRFFIDYRFQHLGLGKESLDIILLQLKQCYPQNPLCLSVAKTNDKAIKLYEDKGFYFTGEFDGNDPVMMKASKE